MMNGGPRYPNYPPPGEAIDPFHDFPYFDDDEGSVEVHMPPAGWNQSPGEYQGDNRGTIRWGDVKTVNVPANPAGGLFADPVLQVLDFYLQMPAVCVVRLSAQELTGIAITGSDLITWTLLVGVGSSTQTKRYQKQLSPNSGATDNDFYLTLPLEHLVATATLQAVQDVTQNRIIEVAAQVAPVTVAPWMVR